MPRGKQTCKILKEIRKQIAAENDIELVVSECTYQGDCLGTCPKCEAEVRYLECELEKRQKLGKAVMISGMALTSMLGMSSCGNNGASSNKASDTQPTDNMEITDDSSDIYEPDYMESLTGYIVDGFEDEFSDVYQITEQMPEFPGGKDEMMKFVQDNVVYPQQAKDAGVEGRVFVSFIVETDGSVSDVKVLHGIGHGCDEVAVEVVQSMPKWKPGFHNGKAVRVGYMLPLSFQLNNPPKN